MVEELSELDISNLRQNCSKFGKINFAGKNRRRVTQRVWPTEVPFPCETPGCIDDISWITLAIFRTKKKLFVVNALCFGGVG